MMLNGRAMEIAAKYVDLCGEYAEIHTVTLVTNGQHGGIDIKIDGSTAGGEDYTRTYVLDAPVPYDAPSADRNECDATS